MTWTGDPASVAALDSVLQHACGSVEVRPSCRYYIEHWSGLTRTVGHATTTKAGRGHVVIDMLRLGSAATCGGTVKVSMLSHSFTHHRKGFGGTYLHGTPGTFLAESSLVCV
jgi:hypothetical protein